MTNNRKTDRENELSPDDFRRSFPPSADSRAEILILGSMPGGESLRRQEYYAFKHNAFWRIMGEIFSFSPDLSYEVRLALLRDHSVALWDVLKTCTRPGSLDSSIRNAEPNDLHALFGNCPSLRRIFCNGGQSYRMLLRFFPDLAALSVQLPSTSPAAALYSYSEKLCRWRSSFIEAMPAALKNGDSANYAEK